MEKIVRHNDVGKEGVKQGSAVVGLLGWDSKEAHMAFRETELFKENVHLLREKNGGIELGHVPFKAA
jgi:heme-degrading monooxygenase HmoA